jgi:hypothetical protein
VDLKYGNGTDVIAEHFVIVRAAARPPHDRRAQKRLGRLTLDAGPQFQ